MDTNRNILFGRWHELKGQVRQRWGKLTNEDLARLSGNTEELANALQQHYGYAKVQAIMEINSWLREYDQRARP